MPAALAPPPSPIDLLGIPVIQTGLAELCLLAICGGVVGTWVVLRQLAFFTHAAGTATFPGSVAAAATGFSPRIAGLTVALGYAGTVHRGTRGRRSPTDASTGVALVVALAVGVVLASDVFASGGGVDRLLFGTALGLDGTDIAFSAVVAGLAVAATVTFGRTWAATGFDPEAARRAGLPVSGADLALLALIAICAVAALPAVGALLVASLFVVPAAIARLLCTRVASLLAASVTIATGQAAAGLYLAVWVDAPPGPAVAVTGTAAYVTCAVIRAIVRPA